MSNVVLGWARPIQVSATAKSVLRELADCADDEGISWPGIETLSAWTCQSIRTVQRALAELVRTGLLEIQRRWHRSSIYRLLVGKVPAAASCRPRTTRPPTPPGPQMELPGIASKTSPVSFCGVTVGHPDPSVEEPSKNPKATPSQPAEPAASPPPLSIDELLWKDGLAVLRALVPARGTEAARSIIGKLLKQCGGHKFAAYTLLRDAMRCNPDSPEDWLFAAARNRARREEQKDGKLAYLDKYRRRPVDNSPVIDQWGARA